MKPFIIGMILAANLVAAFVGLRGMPAGYASQPGGEALNHTRMVASSIKTKVFEKLGTVVSGPSVRKTSNSEKRNTADSFMQATEDRMRRDRDERAGGAKFIKR